MPEHEPIPAADPAALLSGKSWRVEDIDQGGVLDRGYPVVTFGDDGRVSGRATINRFSGTYRLAGGRLSCGPLALTRMAGPEAAMAQEQRLLATLGYELAVFEAGPAVVLAEGGHSLRLLPAEPGEDNTDAPSVGEASAGEGSTLVVRGVVLYRERIAMPFGATVQVCLLDVSRVDAPARVVAELVITDPGNVPVHFELRADASKLDPRARLAVSARIEAEGELRWISDTNNPVSAQAGEVHVDVMVKHV